MELLWWFLSWFRLENGNLGTQLGEQYVNRPQLIEPFPVAAAPEVGKLCSRISALEQPVFAIDQCFFSFTVDVSLNHRQQNFFRTQFIQGLPKENESGARSTKEGITFKGLVAPSHFLTGMSKSLGDFSGERSVWIREVWILNFLEQFKVHSKLHHELQTVAPTW